MLLEEEQNNYKIKKKTNPKTRISTNKVSR